MSKVTAIMMTMLMTACRTAKKVTETVTEQCRTASAGAIQTLDRLTATSVTETIVAAPDSNGVLHVVWYGKQTRMMDTLRSIAATAVSESEKDVEIRKTKETEVKRDRTPLVMFAVFGSLFLACGIILLIIAKKIEQWTLRR